MLYAQIQALLKHIKVSKAKNFFMTKSLIIVKCMEKLMWVKLDDCSKYFKKKEIFFKKKSAVMTFLISSFSFNETKRIKKKILRDKFTANIKVLTSWRISSSDRSWFSFSLPSSNKSKNAWRFLMPLPTSFRSLVDFSLFFFVICLASFLSWTT